MNFDGLPSPVRAETYDVDLSRDGHEKWRENGARARGSSFGLGPAWNINQNETIDGGKTGLIQLVRGWANETWRAYPTLDWNPLVRGPAHPRPRPHLWWV